MVVPDALEELQNSQVLEELLVSIFLCVGVGRGREGGGKEGEGREGGRGKGGREKEEKAKRRQE